MNTRTWVAPLALLLGGSLVASAFAAEIVPIGNTVDDWEPNPLVTQHDNPRFYGHVALDADESVERFKVGPMTGATNGSHRVRLRTTCSPTDQFCVDDFMWTVWPRDPDAGYLTNGEFEYEAFGARIGHQWATLELVKENEQYVQSVADSFDVRLDPETIVVPLHVLVEVPRDQTTNDGVPIMEVFANLREYLAFVDDDFSDPDSVVDVSAPGLGLDINRIFMSQDPVLSGEQMKIGSLQQVRPDDVFDACGIQFRLTGVTFLYDDTSALDETRDPETGDKDGNGALSALSGRMRGDDPNHPTDEVRLVWGTAPRPQDLVLAFVPHVDEITLLEPKGLQYGNVAAVGVYTTSSPDTLVAAHELGHALGLEGPDENHPSCIEDAENRAHLMCRFTGGTDIPGCSRWRSGIERMRDEPDICLEGQPCPERLPDVPFGCFTGSPGGDQFRTRNLDMCLTARQAAASKSVEFSGNKLPNFSIDDAAGNVLVSAQGGENLTTECGGTLDLRRTLITDPSDPFPQYASRVSGWTVTYDNALTNDDDETIEYDGDTSQITVDLDRHLGSSLRVSFRAYDAQSAYASAALSILRPADTQPPALEALPELLLDGCVSTEPREVPWPDAVAADNCGGVTVSGQLVSLNGAELATPIEVTEAGTVFDAAGRYEIEWIATDAAGNASPPVRQGVLSNACLTAGSALTVQNSATILQPDGTPMPLTVLGTGQTIVGGLSVVGPVLSKGPIRVDGGARVAGDVVSAQSIVVQSGATVEGQVRQNQTLNLPAAPTLSGTFPPTCGGNKYYNADSGTHSLAPGCYAELRLGSRAKLHLEAGTYAFKTASIEPSGVLITHPGAKLDIKDSFTFRGSLEGPTGGQGFVPIKYRGNGQLLLESPIHSAVLAPSGKLVLGGANGQVFKGQYFAKNIEVRSGVSIVATDEPPPGFTLQSHRKHSTELEQADLVDGETVLNADEVGCALQHLSTGRKGRGGWLAALFALVWLARVRSRTRAGRGVVR